MFFLYLSEITRSALHCSHVSPATEHVSATGGSGGSTAPCRGRGPGGGDRGGGGGGLGAGGAGDGRGEDGRSDQPGLSPPRVAPH